MEGQTKFTAFILLLFKNSISWEIENHLSNTTVVINYNLLEYQYENYYSNQPNIFIGSPEFANFECY